MKWTFSFLMILVLGFTHCRSFSSAEELTIKGRGRPVEIKTEKKNVVYYEGSFALLIGISKYRHWPNLENIPSELDRLELSLRALGFTVEKSLDLTGDMLKKTIEQFINKYGFEENNRLLIFYSGHGFTRERRGRKIGYIVPADAPSPRNGNINIAKDSIDMEQVLTWAKRIEAKHALFVFDSCFSGTIFTAKNIEAPSYIKDSLGKPVIEFISAGDENQTLPPNSYFILSFIRGIEGAADLFKDGYITGTELGQYLRINIMSNQRGQTPQHGKIIDPELNRGDFVFTYSDTPPTEKNFKINIENIPALVVSSHVSPLVYIYADRMYENLFLLPVTENENTNEYRISRGTKLVFESDSDNGYRFQWTGTDGERVYIYAGGENITRSGITIHFFIVSKEVFEKISPFSLENVNKLDEAITNEQFNILQENKLAVKTVHFNRD